MFQGTLGRKGGLAAEDVTEYSTLSRQLDTVESALKEVSTRSKTYFNISKQLARLNVELALQLGELGLGEATSENAIGPASSALGQIQMAVGRAEDELMIAEELSITAASSSFVKGPIKTAKALRAKYEKAQKSADSSKKTFKNLTKSDRKEPAKPAKVLEAAEEVLKADSLRDTTYQDAYCALSDVSFLKDFDFLERLRCFTEGRLKISGQAVNMFNQLDDYLGQLEEYTKQAESIHLDAQNNRSSALKSNKAIDDAASLPQTI